VELRSQLLAATVGSGESVSETARIQQKKELLFLKKKTPQKIKSLRTITVANMGNQYL